MKTITTLLLILSLTGCVLAPDAIPVEAEHLSHATQHFGADRAAAGGEVLSTGVRWRRYGVTLDVLEGYSPEKLDNRHEVFTARLSTEIPLK